MMVALSFLKNLRFFSFGRWWKLWIEQSRLVQRCNSMRFMHYCRHYLVMMYLCVLSTMMVLRCLLTYLIYMSMHSWLYVHDYTSFVTTSEAYDWSQHRWLMCVLIFSCIMVTMSEVLMRCRSCLAITTKCSQIFMSENFSEWWGYAEIVLNLCAIVRIETAN